ncbi:MAG: FAD-dependent oxidoreductase [Patescibacteria group bacterium]
MPLIKRQEIADKTWAFWFNISDTNFRFKAGQNADFGIGDVRTFSIASSPNNHKAIMIAVRRLDPSKAGQAVSDFKKNLMSMPLGTRIRVQGPLGDFVFPKKSDPLRQGSSEASKPIVMLAGGIGITPMYSMIQWATEEKLPHKITLHFSNSAPERATFLKELEALQAQNPNFKLHLHFKRLTTETLKPDLNSRYYLAGPPGFVAGMRAILDEAGVDEDNIRTEEFSGY